MIKQFVLLIMFILAFLTQIQAQNTFNRTYRRTIDLEPVPNYLSSVVVTDTALYLTGNTFYKDSIYWKEGGFLAKMDYQGNIIKDKVLTDNRSLTFRYDNLRKGIDNNFYGIGRQGQINGCFLFRFDKNLDTIKTIPFSANQFNAYSFRSTACVRDDHGGYYFFVDRFFNSFLGADCLLLKTDSMGNEIWRKQFGMNNHNFGGITIIRKDSRTFWVNILDREGLSTNWDFRMRTITMIIDTSGNLVSQLETPGNRLISGIFTPLQNGDYLLNGSQTRQLGGGATPIVRQLGYIGRYSPTGQLLWERVSETQESFLESAVENRDGSIVAAGKVYNPNPLGVANNRSGFLWKLSAQGDSLWARRYQSFNYVDYMYDYFLGLKKMPDGGFIAYGRALNDDGTRPDGGFWGWMVRTDSFGCVERGCQLRDANEDVQGQLRLSIHVYPNPATHNIHFTWQGIAPNQTFLTLYDVAGKIVAQQPIEMGATQTEINIENQPNGLYFYKMNWGNPFAAGKVIIER